MSPELAAARAALAFLSDRITHAVFEDGSDGIDHIQPIQDALDLMMVYEPVYEAVAKDETGILRAVAGMRAP